jgi:hypothetical protein
MTKTVTDSKLEPEPLKTYYILSMIKATSMLEARNLASVMLRAGYADKIQAIREAK